MAGAAKQGGATYQTRGIAEHEGLCTCSGCARRSLRRRKECILF